MAKLVLVSNTMMNNLYVKHPDIEGTPTYRSEDGRVWPVKEPEPAKPTPAFPPDPLLPNSRIQNLKRLLG